jgi:hypothetical protein
MATAIEQLQADREEIHRAGREGRRPDPEVSKRVRERAEKARQEMLRERGLLNIAVDLIRETRDA